LDDGQLDEAPLTLAEIRKIAESFRFSLQSMLHSRVAYPKRSAKEKETSSPPAGKSVSV
jgi:membrane-associated HD superfamily phosphohydrolase